jgi:hypothetical protein
MYQPRQAVAVEKSTFPIQLSWQWLALIMFVVMQVSWATPWIQSLNISIGAVKPGIILLITSAIVLLTLAGMRLAGVLSLNQGIRRVLSGILLTFSLILGINFMTVDPNAGSFQTLGAQPMNSLGEFLNAIPAWFWITIVVLVLWWYGMRLSNDRVGPITVFNNFRLGIVMFALFALAGFVVPLARAIDPTNVLFYFLISGLISLVASRVSILGYLRGGGKSPFDRRWLLAISLSAIGFVVVAYGAAAILTGQSSSFYGLIAGIFIGIAVILAAPILLVLYLLTPSIEQLQQALPTPMATESLPGTEGIEGIIATGSDFDFLTWGEAFTLSPEVRSLLIVIGVIVVTTLLILSFRWINQRSENMDENLQREDLSGDKNFLEMLREMFQRQLQEAADSVQDRSRMSPRERQMAAERIRVIYGKLLDLAGDSGFPRAASETPLEYQRELAYAFPACETQVAAITTAYIKIRYGQVPETKDDVALIEQAWITIQEEVKRAAAAAV